jgi:hypothetical protein
VNIDSVVPSQPAPNRAERRSAARRARRLGALGSGMVLATSVAGIAITAAPAGADTRVVTNLDDAGPGSLRQALADANDGDVIDLSGLTGTITLTTGQLEITDVVTIQGPGPGALTISGNNASRVFNMRDALTGAGTVVISGLTITGGNVNGAGAGVNFDCFNTSANSLVVENVVITGNTGTYLGGGLYFDRCGDQANLTISNSSISGNQTTSSGGGGVWFDEGDTMLVENSTIAGNQALYGGGGVTFDDGGQLVIRNSTVSGNISGTSGGGLYLSGNIGSVTITNSTIANNQAAETGGAMVAFNPFPITILQSTISGNTAGLAGDAIYFFGYSVAEAAAPQGQSKQDDEPSASVAAGEGYRAIVTGSIVAGNGDGTDDIATETNATAEVTSASSILGALSTGVSLVDSGGNHLNVTSPGLKDLADNGGPTQTMALELDSPAIDNGPDPVPEFPGNEYDQRGVGFDRVVNNKVDIGAFEVQPKKLDFTG